MSIIPQYSWIIKNKKVKTLDIWVELTASKAFLWSYKIVYSKCYFPHLKKCKTGAQRGSQILSSSHSSNSHDLGLESGSPPLLGSPLSDSVHSLWPSSHTWEMEICPGSEKAPSHTCKAVRTKAQVRSLPTVAQAVDVGLGFKLRQSKSGNHALSLPAGPPTENLSQGQGDSQTAWCFRLPCSPDWYPGLFTCSASSFCSFLPFLSPFSPY